ncbi:MAG: 4Fe-4S dicluster domain-containing protein [Nitrospirae bacterium]|nr:4Fe-4S dicluster domain-containing protein [Nitrospirota bacterium]
MGKKEDISRRDMLKTGGAVAVAAAATGILPAAAAAAKEGVSRWAMVIDLRRCIGCRGCTVACKSEFGAALGRWNAVVKQMETGSYPGVKKHFLPRLCNHCAGEKDVPPCVEKCPQANAGERAKLGGVSYRTGATYKRPDGMILLDMSLCIGCYKCIEACPYGVRSIDPFSKLTRPDREKDLGVGKCTFCAHRVDKGIAPSCVNTCQGGARIFGDLNDPESEVSKLDKEFNLVKNRDKTTLLPGEKTQPHVLYIDPAGVLAQYKIDKKTKEAEFKDQFV